MLFSIFNSVERTDEDDWFDPVLNADTALFVDPFAIFKEGDELWGEAYAALVAHFDTCFELIAQGDLNPQSLPYRKALDLLTFREPREFCLGYTSDGTAGLGAGRGLAKATALAMSDAIRRGLNDLQHFEELGILNEGIGPDRISDITCNVLKRFFVEYTQDVARRHDIPVEVHRVWNASYDVTAKRWDHVDVELPTNGLVGGPVLLTPARFLRDLPVINAEDWWSWYQAEQIKVNVNYELLSNVNKARIVATARQNPDWVRRWTEERSGRPADPYDLGDDPKGVWLWASAAFEFTRAEAVSLPTPSDETAFFDVIDRVVARYKLFVEEKGGWRLLWNDDGTEKLEQAAQLLFRGIAEYDCAANNIVLDPEVNLGRGPVDFKFTNGYAHRAHLEVKKLHTGSFWDGLGAQLVSYMRSDEVTDGWLLAVRYRDGGVSEDRAADLPTTVAATGTANGLALRYALVDGRPKESASKLKRKPS